MREATPDDLSWIEALCVANIQTSMFLLQNLRDHGLGGTSEYAMRVWVRPDKTGVFAVTNGGMVMLHLPFAEDKDWAFARSALTGRDLIGVLGDAPQVRQALNAMGLASAPTRVDDDDQNLTLYLSEMTVPDCAGFSIAPPSSNELELLVGWRSAYHQSTLGTPVNEARDRAAADIDRYMAADSHRVLWHHGAPVGFTGFNARQPEAVQIGGVFTPPELRGRGYARRAVALHLQEAQAQGVQAAVLFAANDAATRAYRALGFQTVGRFALVIFDGMQRVQT